MTSGYRIIESAHGRTGAAVHGTGSSMVLLHGSGTGASSFEPLQKALEDTFTTVALDLPGFGESSAAGQPLASPGELAGIVIDVIGQAEIATYHLVGFGAGAAVAARVAALDNLRVRKLMLMAPEADEAAGAAPSVVTEFLALEDWHTVLTAVRASTFIVAGRDTPELAELTWVKRFMNYAGFARVDAPERDLLTTAAAQTAAQLTAFARQRPYNYGVPKRAD
jgi:pimeloyl-ACP methyl ester carboxylesterase